MNRHLFTDLATRKGARFLRQLPDPDAILIKTGKHIDAYRDLTTDPHVFANIQQRKSGVLALNRAVERNGAAEAVYAAVLAGLAGLDMENAISQLLNAPLFGIAVLEVTWRHARLAHGRRAVLPRAAEEKPQEWFAYNPDNVLCYTAGNAGVGMPLPPYKFIIARNNPTYSNPYGERALARCYWPVTFKRSGQQFWLLFMEKYGMPFLLGKEPRGTGEQESSVFLEQLEGMVQDSIAVVNDDNAVEFLTAGGTQTSESYKLFTEFCNSEISKAILTQTLTTEIPNRGSYSASRTHLEMLDNLADSDRRIVEKGVTTLIRWIVDLNFGAHEPAPYYRLFPEEDVNKELAERDEILTRQGVRLSSAYYRKMYNLSPDDMEDEERNTSLSFSKERD